MIKKDKNNNTTSNIESFKDSQNLQNKNFEHYAKFIDCTKEEVVALLLYTDPKNIYTGSYRGFYYKKGLQDKEGNFYKESFCKKYNQRMELLEDALYNNTIPHNKSSDWIEYNDWPKVKLLDVIRWCESKDFTFPKELEELVIKYNKSKDVEIYVQDSVLNKENIPKESYKGQKTGGKNNLLNEKMFFIEKIKEELNEKIPDYEKKLISNILTKYQKSELKALSVDNAKKTLREWTKKYFNNKTLFDRSEE